MKNNNRSNNSNKNILNNHDFVSYLLYSFSKRLLTLDAYFYSLGGSWNSYG